jgi:hypothetical protein
VSGVSYAGHPVASFAFAGNASASACLSATGFDNSAASRTEPPFVRFEAIRNRIVPLILHLSAKSLHIRSTNTLLFGSAKVARRAASLGKSNRR